MTKRSSIGLFILAAVFAGCDDKDAPLTQAQFCEQKAKHECQVATRCGVMTDVCVAARSDECRDFAKESSTVTRAYKSDNVGPCLDKTKSVYAKSTITQTDLAALNEACGRVFEGSSTTTDSCTVDYDCLGPLVCDKAKCGARVAKNKGEQCSNAGEVCALGSYCASSDNGSHLCTARATKGQPCSATAPCLENLRCNGATCADRFGIGETCANNDDCASAAPYCDRDNQNTCQVGLMFAPKAPACSAYGAASSVDAGSGDAGDAGGDSVTASDGKTG